LNAFRQGLVEPGGFLREGGQRHQAKQEGGEHRDRGFCHSSFHGFFLS
jgi:hypothetical protein